MVKYIRVYTRLADRLKEGYRRDYRKVRLPKEDYPKVVIRWFHWSKYPRPYILYWDDRMKEMRHKTLGLRKKS